MNIMDNYVERWKAALEEYGAEAERFDAEERLRYDEWIEDMQAKFYAVGNWTEAAWEDFTAKAEQQWHDSVIRFSTKDNSTA